MLKKLSPLCKKDSRRVFCCKDFGQENGNEKNEFPFTLVWLGLETKVIVLSQFPYFLIYLKQSHQQSHFKLLPPLTIPSTIFLQISTYIISHQQYPSKSLPSLTIITNHINKLSFSILLKIKFL